MRLASSYKKKTTTCSDATKATVVAGDSAVNGTQSLQVNKIAKAGYLTGAELDPVKTEYVRDENGKVVYDDNGKPKTKKVDWKVTDKISEIDKSLIGQKISVTVGTGDKAKTTEVEITDDMSISTLTRKLSEAGVNASFDENNQRFFITSASTGVENDFTIKGSGSKTLEKLGLDVNATYSNGSQATKTAAEDSEIILNGAKFTSSSNAVSYTHLRAHETG